MSKETDHNKIFVQVFNAAIGVTVITLFVFGLMVTTLVNPTWLTPESENQTNEPLELAIDVAGFVQDDGREVVAQNCTRCHSAKLVTQNRATREGWKSMIVWMQETQNLWPLGVNEPIILDYLSKNYGPQKKGRRQNLANIEWYELEE